MIDAIAVGLTKDYIAKQERAVTEKGKERPASSNPTIWIIGAIDSIMKAMIQASWVDVETNQEGKPNVKRNDQKFIQSDFDIVRYGLKGFKNFSNNEVEFKTQKIRLFDREVEIVSDETIKQIPLAIIHELADVIWTDNHVDEGLRKN